MNIANMQLCQSGKSLQWRHQSLHADDPLQLWQGLLKHRGLQESDVFFAPRLAALPDPYDMQDMYKAVERITQAIHAKEKIHIFGDFDCDGCCASTVLLQGLQALGAQVTASIPHRVHEGHGIPSVVLRQQCVAGVTLGISVDTGTSCFIAADSAKECGMDLIITDHHQPDNKLPNVFALLNPARDDCGFAKRLLCGAGVAFFLLLGLRKYNSNNNESSLPSLNMRSMLGLVAIATVADVMRLQGVNRILVHHGLVQLCNEPSIGMQALLKISRCDANLRAQDIAFRIAPRINAASRMAHGETILHLMCCNDIKQARLLAEDLDAYNRQRQQVERRTLRQVEAHIEANNTDVLAVYQSDWHAGVIGLVAGKLARRFGKPAAVGYVDAKNKIRISLRGVAGFNIAKLLQQCHKHLQGYGGHAGAGGASMLADNWPAFIQDFSSACEQQKEQAAHIMATEIDATISPDAVHPALLTRLQRFEPCGVGNPSMLFGIHEATIQHIKIMNNNSYRLQLVSKIGTKLEAIAFRAKWLEQFLHLGEKSPLLIGRLENNNWQGNNKIQFVIEDAAVNK
ncbi:MAG: single-stranded-DNA-specific exonuclease RecJ [Mariprofundales bacterium]